MRPLVPVAALLLALAGCGADDTSTKPTFEGGSQSGAADTSALADDVRAAGIDPCPETNDAGTKDARPVEGGLPDLVLTCFGSDEPVHLAGLRGPAVVNVWASWCGPCKAELPHLARLHDELGDRVQVLGVDLRDPDPEAALALLEGAGVTYPSVTDPDEEIRAGIGLRGVPTTLMVDADGEVVANLPVPWTSYDRLADAVEQHLGVRP